MFDPQKRANERNKFKAFNPNKPKAPKRWSHQDLLDSLKGQAIEFRMLDEGWRKGVLLEADQFTILVREESKAVCVHKSALTEWKAA